MWGEKNKQLFLFLAAAMGVAVAQGHDSQCRVSRVVSIGFSCCPRLNRDEVSNK